MPYTQLTARYTGFTGATGWTRFKFIGSLDNTQTAACAARARAFLNVVAGWMPNGTFYNFDPTATHHADDGTLMDELAYGSVPTQIVGASSAKYPGGVGVVVNWITGTVHGGRKIRGKTFLVPLTSDAFTATGSVNPTLVSDVNTAATALATGTPALCINSQHASHDTAGPMSAEVISGKVSTLPAELHSRKV